MEKRIFVFSKLRQWDIATLILYLILTIYIHLTFTNNKLPDYAKGLIFGYIFGTMVFNYMFNYKSLRNMTVFVIWIVFGIYHLWLSKQIESVQAIYFDTSPITNGLKYSILILIIQQIIRFSYIKLTSMEIVAPVKGGGPDLFDNRYTNFFDHGFFVLYMIIIILIWFI